MTILESGSEIAGYRIESLIGRGGMAVVYCAEDVRLGRKVALKLLPPQLSDNEQFRKRFIRESRLAASLEHPNIVPIYGAGEAEGQLFIAMRYVLGSDLRGLLSEQGGPLPLDRMLRLFGQIGDALDTAHQAGLVHRDVKPDNFLIAAGHHRPGQPPGDHCYLTDFGITKRTTELSGGLTASGQFLGTADYVSPEQIQGRPVGPTADIYALGCVLYECLTGQQPFRRDDEAALLWAHLVDMPPPITGIRPELPAAVNAVLARAMAKEPADRYASCQQLVNELAQALGRQPPVPSAGGRSTGNGGVAPPRDQATPDVLRAAPVPGVGDVPGPGLDPPSPPDRPARARVSADASPGTAPPAVAAAEVEDPLDVPLEVRVGDRRWVVPPQETVTLGRDAEVGGPITDGRVSRRHATVQHGAAGWVLSDHSRNGVFLAGRRTPQVVLTGSTVVMLGHPVEGVAVTLTPLASTRDVPGGAPPTHAALSAVHHLPPERLAIGRSPDNDVVVDDLLVSRHHAVLERTPGGWRLRDLDSANGTFLNGRGMDEALVAERDLIGVGRTLLQLAGDRLVQYEDRGDVDIEADGLVVIRDGRRLLDGVGFRLPGRSLMAVLGPSGSGKSTLLGALTGTRPADSGGVSYGGRDLYDEYEELQQRIGVVPQDDILHPQLTVRRALSYAARLRFPPDVPAMVREQRIQEVLDELGLAERADLRIDRLSGGQRKRTSVALELLTRPSLLFLDEPTSGLDPGLDKQVMGSLRDLADGGRTVVVVTHSVANLDVCDRLLILAPGGRVAYDGPPRRALDHFGVTDFADVFTQLEDDSATDWAARFRSSDIAPRQPARSVPRAAPAAPAPRRRSGFAQFPVLCRRTFDVMMADRTYLIFLALLPVLLSGVAHALPAPHGLSTAPGDVTATQLLLVLTMSGTLMGTASSIRELVKERTIYERERSIGLSSTAYLAAKLTVLGLVTAVQAAVFCAVALLGRAGPDGATTLGSGRLEIGVSVVAVTCASMVLGLVISTAIGNADRGMPLLVLTVMVQLVLAGGLFPLVGRAGLDQLSWLLPSRWGFAMGAATMDLGKVPPPVDDPLWRHSSSAWTADLLVLAALALVMTCVVAWGLWQSDPTRRRRSARPRRRFTRADSRPGVTAA
ncbi:ATP-binding cassette domain-containing protein [Modestobacter sp. I12A-02662]|uniref:protein kinase domain-containing protein n=1 Tax=Modestobacter sp. I12A-02662 TaxID=1730496 RepID=UPI0034DF6E0B